MSQRQAMFGLVSPLQRVSAGLVAALSLLGAFVASSCCLLPLALFALGIGGAWTGNLAALAPYQPLFVLATLACLGTGYWMVRRQPKGACETEAGCGTARSHRLVLVGLWSSTLLVAAAAAFPFVGPSLLGV